MSLIPVRPKLIPLRPNQVSVTAPGYRPLTRTDMIDVVFSMMAPEAKTAALGDMICWLPAIKWVAETYNFVRGTVVVPPWFEDITKNVFREFPHWRINTTQRLPVHLDGVQLRTPHRVPVNATGFHLIDLGFMFFTQLPCPEDKRKYLVLDLEDVLRPEIDGPYAVMTPGTSSANRMWSVDAYNKTCDHLLSKGITPVHLGTTDMKHRPVAPTFNKGYDLSKGVNLIDCTTLLQAAKIMEGAVMVLGIDNGLLHLAAMTDVTILYGYTIAGPNQRRVYRDFGKTFELYDDSPGACRFCQEWARFHKNHHFTDCIYQENEPQCARALNAESWIATINKALE